VKKMGHLPKSIPVLGVFGDQSRTIAAIDEQRGAEDLRERYANAMPSMVKATILPGKNVLPYERPTEFASVLQEFISSL